jgi:chemotaxis protein MotB
MRKLMIVFGLAALAGCGGISKETYGAKEAEATKYKQAAQDADAKVKALQQQNDALQQQKDSLQQQNAALQQQASATKSELETTAAKLNEQSGEYAKLKDRTIKLSEHLLFKENSSKLSPESKRALDAMGDAIATQKDKAVIVAGYTDDAEGGKGATVKRWQLSTARALEVAKYLAGRGLEPERIAIAGFGEGRPVAANDSLANRALNRRAEIALTPKNLELGTVDVNPATLNQK